MIVWLKLVLWPRRTEFWVQVVGCHSKGHRVGDFHVCFLTPVSSTTILRTFIILIWFLVPKSIVWGFFDDSINLFIGQLYISRTGFQGTTNVSIRGLLNEEVLVCETCGNLELEAGRRVRYFQENIIEMNNGCICCTVRGDLIAGLKKMATAPVTHSHNDMGDRAMWPPFMWFFEFLSDSRSWEKNETVKQMISNLKIWNFGTLWNVTVLRRSVICLAWGEEFHQEQQTTWWCWASHWAGKICVSLGYSWVAKSQDSIDSQLAVVGMPILLLALDLSTSLQALGCPSRGTNTHMLRDSPTWTRTWDQTRH